MRTSRKMAIYASGNYLPKYTFSGTSELIDDGSGNWRIKFKSTGTLVFEKDTAVDIFLVGGGGTGGSCGAYGGGGGGGSGRTKTVSNLSIVKATSYTITIAGAGGTTSALSQSAGGGSAGATQSGSKGGNGGAGGSGGGGGKYHATYGGGAGGSNGANGASAVGETASQLGAGGAGNDTITYEFWETGTTLYAGGGGGADAITPASIGAAALDANSKVIPAQASARSVDVSASKTLALSDAGTRQSVTAATAITITIPPDSSVAWPDNTEIEVLQIGAGLATIAPGTGVTLNSDGPSTGARTLAGQYMAAALVKTAANTWVIVGALS